MYVTRIPICPTVSDQVAPPLAYFDTNGQGVEESVA